MRLCCQFFTILGILSGAVAAQAGDIVGTVNLGRDNSNAAVYIERIPGKTFPAPAQNPKIDQKQMVFIPHVLPILLGTTVEFHNSDTVLHNVFTPSPAGDKVNLGTWPAGVVKTHTFKKPGIVAVLCNVHPEMSGYIVVVGTPYFAVTNRDGDFEIKDVPPGHYTLTTWSEEGKPVTQAVDVTAGAVTVNLTVHR